MEILPKILKSRTVWTIVIMFILGGVQAIQGSLEPQLFLFIQGALTLLAGYFKVNPSQSY
jgi:hypothetical protein